jgi:predicted MFS family arabinose efflux permease
MVFASLSFLVFIVYSQMYTPLSMYSKGFVGISEAEIGVLLAINGIMVVTLQYFVTLVADRYRITLAMAVGVLLYAAGFALVSVSQGFVMLAICIFLITMGELWFIPAQITLATNLSSGDNRGRYLGFSGLTTNMGSAVGPLIGGMLLTIFAGSAWAVWVIVGAAGLACAAGFLYLRKLVPPEKNSAALAEA